MCVCVQYFYSKNEIYLIMNEYKCNDVRFDKFVSM